MSSLVLRSLVVHESVSSCDVEAHRPAPCRSAARRLRLLAQPVSAPASGHEHHQQRRHPQHEARRSVITRSYPLESRTSAELRRTAARAAEYHLVHGVSPPPPELDPYRDSPGGAYRDSPGGEGTYLGAFAHDSPADYDSPRSPPGVYADNGFGFVEPSPQRRLQQQRPARPPQPSWADAMALPPAVPRRVHTVLPAPWEPALLPPAQHRHHPHHRHRHRPDQPPVYGEWQAQLHDSGREAAERPSYGGGGGGVHGSSHLRAPLQPGAGGGHRMTIIDGEVVHMDWCVGAAYVLGALPMQHFRRP